MTTVASLTALITDKNETLENTLRFVNNRTVILATYVALFKKLQPTFAQAIHAALPLHTPSLPCVVHGVPAGAYGQLMLAVHALPRLHDSE
jgi:hypothetical protein